MIQEAYKYVGLSLCPLLMFFELNANIWKSSEWGREKSGVPWQWNFLQPQCVSCRTNSLQCFNGLRCKLAKIALFIFLIEYWVEYMTSSVLSFACFTLFFKIKVNISGTNAGICLFHFFTEFCDTPKNSRGKNETENVVALRSKSTQHLTKRQKLKQTV